MEQKPHTPIEEMEVFRRYVDVADWVWDRVERWPRLAQDTVGTQLIRSCDSVGANLVEGDGRASDPDATRFFVIARASAREARYWLKRAVKRRLVSAEEGQARIEELTGATQLLNRLIKYRRGRFAADRVSDGHAPYFADPFVDHS